MATRLEEMVTEYVGLVEEYCESLQGEGKTTPPTLTVIDNAQFRSVRSVSESAPTHILEREDELIQEAEEIDRENPDVGARSALREAFQDTAKRYAIKPNTGPQK